MFHDIIEMWYVIETICGLHLEGRNYMVLVKKKVNDNGNLWPKVYAECTMGCWKLHVQPGKPQMF